MEIWKYELEVADEQIIEMPSSAKILTVQTQHDAPYIWAAVIPTNTMMLRKIRIAGTGHVILTAERYIGTFQQLGGNLVWHVFDEGEKY